MSEINPVEDFVKAKLARKQKIRELEASLFGSNGDQYWSEKKTELPQLKRVDEFKDQLNEAERKGRKKSALFNEPQIRRESFFLQNPPANNDPRPEKTTKSILPREEISSEQQPLTLAKKLIKEELASVDHGLYLRKSGLTAMKKLGEKCSRILSPKSAGNYEKFDEPDFDALSVHAFRSKMSSARTIDSIPARVTLSRAHIREFNDDMSHELEGVPERPVIALMQPKKHILNEKSEIEALVPMKETQNDSAVMSVKQRQLSPLQPLPLIKPQKDMLRGMSAKKDQNDIFDGISMKKDQNDILNGMSVKKDQNDVFDGISMKKDQNEILIGMSVKKDQNDLHGQMSMKKEQNGLHGQMSMKKDQSDIFGAMSAKKPQIGALRPLSRKMHPNDSSNEMSPNDSILSSNLRISRRGSDIALFGGLENAFANMPTNTFSQLDCSKTFEDIPSNVFEQIPNFESPQEQARREQIQKMLQSSKAAKGESKPPSVEKEGPGEKVYEADFIALFIAEDASGRNASGVSARRRRHSTTIEIGHFCAPFWPGFCEANFCILHSSSGSKAERDRVK